MTKEKFMQQLVIERFKLHMAHLIAVLHMQEACCADNTLHSNIDARARNIALDLESTKNIIRAMNDDLNVLEKSLEKAG